MKPRALLLPLAASIVIAASNADYLSVKRKFGLIEQEKVPRGTKVMITDRELNAYVENEVRNYVADGVRDARLELGGGVATGFARIDFLKVRRASGAEPGWLVSKLLDGERPVRVIARIRSAAGKATVDVERVEISGVGVEGRALDFL